MNKDYVSIDRPPLKYLTRFPQLSIKISAQLKSTWRYLPGVAAAVISIGLVTIRASQPVEDFAYNRLTELRGERAWDDRVVVVEIDDRSIREFKDLSTNRAYYTKVIDILRRAGASTIVFDQIFSDTTPEDAEFVRAINQHQSVILARSWDSQGNPILPTKQLRSAAQGIGHIDRIGSHDRVVRQIQLSKNGVEALASVAVNRSHLTNHLDYNTNLIDRNFWINWPGKIAKTNHYSFSQILNPQTARDKQRLIDGFNQKIVLIGITANNANRIETPFDRSDEASNIYLQAAILNNLLQQIELTIIPNRWIFLILLVISPLLSYQLTRLTHGQRSIVIFSLCGGWIVSSVIALGLNYWLPVSAPIMVFLFTLIGVAYCERQYTDFLVQREIDRLWQTYQINLVARTPESGDSQLFSPIPVDKVVKLATLAAALGKSQSAQAAIADSLSMGLLATELDGTVWFCNPVATQLLNISIGDCIDDFLVPEWLTAVEWAEHRENLQSCRSLPTKELKRHNDFFTIKLEPLFNWQEIQQDIIDGKNIEEISVVSGFLLIIENITAAKQLQSLLLDRERHRHQELTQENIELGKARQLAESVAKIKSEFLANMSHEIRTPLNPIVGLTSLLLETNLTDEQRDFIETIRSSSTMLLGTIDEILDFSKLEAGQMHLEQIDFNLEDLLDRVIRVLANNAYSKGIELSYRLGINIPTNLQGDPTKLSQILTNLIGNAIKFTDRGGVSIDVTEIKTTVDRTTLYFQVKDTGIGVDPDNYNKLFQPFSQADSSTTRQYGGTGLGLAISKRSIEMMGGEIGILEPLDTGSTFWFTLTLKHSQTQPTIDPALNLALKGQHLLIAGNWVHSCQQIADLAEYYGAIVTITSTHTQTLEKLLAAAHTHKSFDLLITDLTFPDSPNLTVPEQISHYPQLANLRILSIVAYPEFDRAKLLQESALITAYVLKPAKPLHLLTKLIEFPQSSLQLATLETPPPKIISNLRILVAEDNKINQKVVLNQLKSLGYTADLACDGEEVLAQIATQHYDAILMDCHMPRLDGYATTQAIRLREGTTRHTVIIALTASAMKDDLELAIATGMDDFLSKPVRKEDLSAKITQWTQKLPLHN